MNYLSGNGRLQENKVFLRRGFVYVTVFAGSDCHIIHALHF